MILVCKCGRYTYDEKVWKFARGFTKKLMQYWIKKEKVKLEKLCCRCREAT